MGASRGWASRASRSVTRWSPAPPSMTARRLGLRRRWSTSSPSSALPSSTVIPSTSAGGARGSSPPTSSSSAMPGTASPRCPRSPSGSASSLGVSWRCRWSAGLPASRRWAESAAREYRRHGGLYIHLKGPDEPGHDRDPAGKKAVIEVIDRAFFGTLLQGVSLEDALVAVTADHATPSTLGRHSDDPVPLLVAGAGVPADGVRVFSEAACAEGSLGTLRGVDVLPLLVTMAAGDLRPPGAS